MKHTLILIPASFNDDELPLKYHFNKTYITAIEHAGGLPIGIMRPNAEDAEALLAHADGLFLMGGNDVDSARYAEPNRACISCEPLRDELELLLIRKAMERRMPILVICRGFQVLNTVMGGSLHQDIEHEMEGGMHHDYHYDSAGTLLKRNILAHKVDIAEHSLLASLANTSNIGVNSLHHQGIKTLGRGLRAVAHAPDGLIEAVEIEDYPFGLGVQWHPEELGGDVSTKIFSAFIDAAKKYHETKNRS